MKNKSDIFRLAAVLYADSNDDVSTEKVYRRIIESIFIDNENHCCPLKINNCSLK